MDKKLENIKKLKEEYKSIIKKLLFLNNVKEITFVSGDFARVFIKAEVSKDSIKVFPKGLCETTFSDFLFDYTIDYAQLIYQIEDAIFFAQRGYDGSNKIKIKFYE